MEKKWRISIAENRLSAQFELFEHTEKELSIKIDDLKELLIKEKIAFGVKEDLLKEVSEDPVSFQYPVLIAEGIPSMDGSDAYLVNEVQNKDISKREKFNFRNVLKIPSVKSGSLLASIIPQTPGSQGMDVFGHPIPARTGKPLKIRPGKNVILNGNQFYSLSDGQVSLTDRLISVHPVFEVKGDLDLKTGNIDFIGNVVIRGNVPAGYEIKAGGDIRIFGLVEGANLLAKGNITITGGISGGNKGSVTAEGNISAAYLNQANINAGQDILINKSILHSAVNAKGTIHCENSLVIGGILTSGTDIHIKDLGNHLFTKTVLYAGVDVSLSEREKELKEETIKLNENHQKLDSIEHKLLGMARLTGKLTEDQKSIIIKQRTTKSHIRNQLIKLNEQLDDLEREKEEKMAASIYIYKSIYPNSSLHFGKYAKIIQQKHSYCRFYFSNGDINFEPIR